tara:strand:- start:1204 stop:1518 length:315 start_codon:yes stop_codon:yes gene_type:complete
MDVSLQMEAEERGIKLPEVPEYTVFFFDDSGAIPAGMSEDLTGWYTKRSDDTEPRIVDERADGPFVTEAKAFAKVENTIKSNSLLNKSANNLRDYYKNRKRRGD